MEPHGNLVSGPDSGVYIEGGGGGGGGEEERGSKCVWREMLLGHSVCAGGVVLRLVVASN